jgi:hypothetical protein
MGLKFKENNMKTYGYLPIIKANNLPDLTPFPEFHNKRFKECITEMVAKLAQIQNEEIRMVLAEYHACLIEKEDGSKSIGVDFPQKRFS